MHKDAQKPAQEDVTVGNFYLVVDAAVFGEADEVRRRATSIAEYVRASAPAPGVERVLAPGDVELAARRTAEEQGVELLASTIRDFHRIAEEFAVDLPLLAPVG